MWWGTVADRPHFFFPSKDDNFFFFLWSCFMKSVKRWINKIEWATLQRYYTQYDNNTNTIWVLFEAFSPILKFVLGRNSSFFSQNKYIFYWPRTKLVLTTPLFLSFQGWQFFFLFVVMFHEICEKMNKQNWMSYITTLLYTVWQQYKHNLGIVWGLLTNIEICLGSEFVIFQPK